MSLKDKLTADLKAAMREKDTIKKNTVTMIRAAVKQLEVDQRIEADDAKITEIISKQMKEKKQALAEFEKAARQDLIDQTKKEMEILLEYLPKQLSQDEVLALVKKTVEEGGYSSKKDIGKIMKDVMPKIKGVADGRMVQEAINKIFE